jgi:signal transduction histidine kinase
MTVSLVSARFTSVFWRHPDHSRCACTEVSRVVDEKRAGWLLRLTTAGIIGWDLVEVARLLYLSLLQSPMREVAWQTAATVIYLPMQIILIRAAISGQRPRLSWWLLGGVALVIGVTLPFGGVDNVLVLWVPAALGLLYVRPPWSFAVFLGVVALGLIVVLSVNLSPAGAVLDRGFDPVRFRYAVIDTMILGWGAISFAALVWLARIITALATARRRLAARAVVAERQRIDDEVDRAIGSALEHIIARGEAAATRVLAGDRLAAASELRMLTEQSREALAEARGLLGGYRRVSAEAELRAAITLLAAGGVRADLEIPAAGLPPELPAEVRTRLRTLVAEALRADEHGDRSLRVLAIAVSDGRLTAELRCGETR